MEFSGMTVVDGGFQVTAPPPPAALELRIIEAQTVALPVTGQTYSVTVNWGDGNVESFTSPTAVTHGYASTGSYTVSITGSLTGFGGAVDNSIVGKIAEVVSWGNLGLTTLANAFQGAIYLTNVPNNLPSTVTNVQFMFNAAGTLIGGFNDSNLAQWNVSNVTNMAYMFNGCAFNQNIGGWNVSNVANMVGMFQSSPFNQNIGSWNVSNVTNTFAMFYNDDAFNQPIGNWNVGNVTDMGEMFFSTAAFNQPIGNWNVSKVTSMSAMFKEAVVFNQDIGNWNVGNVTNMTELFFASGAFNQDLTGWCVTNFPTIPPFFANSSALDANNYPVWGTCP